MSDQTPPQTIGDVIAAQLAAAASQVTAAAAASAADAALTAANSVLAAASTSSRPTWPPKARRSSRSTRPAS